MATPIIISEAPEAQRIGHELVKLHHPHLRDAVILYLFTTQKRKKCDRVRLGSAQKVSPLQRYLSTRFDQEAASADFILLFDRTEWGMLRDSQRQALVDHELCHCGGYPGKWRVLGHDVEEFVDVIHRHGLWRHEIKGMADALSRQTVLPLEVAA